MKKVYETEYRSTEEDFESATAIALFELETKEEQETAWDISQTDDPQERHDLWSEWFRLWDDYGVMPGARYHRYGYRYDAPWVIVSDTVSVNC